MPLKYSDMMTSNYIYPPFLPEKLYYIALMLIILHLFITLFYLQNKKMKLLHKEIAGSYMNQRDTQT